MVSNVKQVRKGSKVVKNVQGIKKVKNSAKADYMRRVDISTTNIYLTQNHSQNCFTAFLFHREVKYYLNLV